jgi:membrane-associated protease RseP (regulator of RpoE activity)
MKSPDWTNAVAIAGMLLLATMSLAAEPAAPAPPAPPAPPAAPAPPATPSEQLQVPAVESEVKLSEYWLGVLCAPHFPDALRAHVELPEGQGLLVHEVVPDGPGAKAGVRPMDILVKVDGKAIGKVADLAAAVEAAKDKELSIELLRKGKTETIKVTPVKRPADYQAKQYPAVPDQPELERIYRWFERVHPGLGGRPPMRLRFFHPGVVLPEDAPMHPPLPAGMSITIVKAGEEPTRITVKRGEESWEVTEKELDKLPQDIRAAVDRMLGGVILSPEDLGSRFDFLPDFAAPGEPGKPADESGGLKGRLEERLDKMNQRMQKMQEMIEGLQKDKAGPEEKK